MLLIGDPQDDPALAGLSTSAWNAWADAAGLCSSTRSDIVQLARLDASDEIVDELVQAELVKRLPFGNLRLLHRGTLWEV